MANVFLTLTNAVNTVKYNGKWRKWWAQESSILWKSVNIENIKKIMTCQWTSWKLTNLFEKNILRIVHLGFLGARCHSNKHCKTQWKSKTIVSYSGAWCSGWCCKIRRALAQRRCEIISSWHCLIQIFWNCSFPGRPGSKQVLPNDRYEVLEPSFL